MNTRRQWSRFFSVFFFVTLVAVRDAHAYLDPGTGSYILQLLIGAFLGAMYAVKLCWSSIKMFFSRLFGKKTSAAVPPAAEQKSADKREKISV